jgi:hypothetical protein
LLAAMLLIAVGSLATITMQRTALKKNNLTDTRQTGAQLAREILETVRQTNYISTNLNTTSGNFITLGGGTRPGLIQGTTNPGNIFTRQLKVDDNTPINNVKKIQIQVTWNQSGVTQGLLLATFKTRDN